MNDQDNNDLSDLDYACCEFSDVHKEIHGVRSSPTVARGEALTVAMVDAQIADLLAGETQREAAAEAKRVAFLANITDMGLDPAKFAYLW